MAELADALDSKYYFRRFHRVSQSFTEAFKTLANIGQNSLFACHERAGGSEGESSTFGSTEEIRGNRPVWPRSQS